MVFSIKFYVKGIEACPNNIYILHISTFLE